MNQFSKPSSRKPREEDPEGLDAFVNAVPGTVVQLVTRSVLSPEPEVEPDADVEPDVHGMNVRFNATEKAALVKLARFERRSQHQVLKLLLVPALLEAAAKVP